MCLHLSLVFLDESEFLSVYSYSFLSVTFLAKCGLDSVEKSDF